MRKITFLFCAFLFSWVAKSQNKINLDSLLLETHKELNINKNYEKAKKLSQLGIKIAPEYLDFRVELGKYYFQKKQLDSAFVCYKTVVDKNPKYKEVFHLILSVSSEQEKYYVQKDYATLAINNYPDEKEFYENKLFALENIFNQNPDSNQLKQELIDFLEFFKSKFPEETALNAKLLAVKSFSRNQRIGISFTHTQFSRNEIKPIELGSVFYINQKNRLTYIGRLNYLNKNVSNTKIDGIQYEVEGYQKHFTDDYSFITASYSTKQEAFPKWRLGYSYNHSFKKGWEGDIGVRYVDYNSKIFTAVIGVGKYFKNYWINLKNYTSFIDKSLYPSFVLNSRYYQKSKYDYFSAQMSYGLSNDDRMTTNSNFQNSTLKSYMIGVGVQKLLQKKWILAAQINTSKQEYIIHQYQTQIDFFISLQYILNQQKK